MNEKMLHAIEFNEIYLAKELRRVMYVIKKLGVLGEKEVEERADEIIDLYMESPESIKIIEIPIDVLLDLGIAQKVDGDELEISKPTDLEYLYDEILSNYDEEDVGEIFDGYDD